MVTIVFAGIQYEIIQQKPFKYRANASKMNGFTWIYSLEYFAFSHRSATISAWETIEKFLWISQKPSPTLNEKPEMQMQNSSECEAIHSGSQFTIMSGQQHIYIYYYTGDITLTFFNYNTAAVQCVRFIVPVII